MMKLESLQTFIRSNGFAWPGCYPCAMLMADGYIIDSQVARENYKQIRRAMQDYSHEWTPVEVFVHWEGAPLLCDVSGRYIESAYGVPEEETN